MENYLLGCDWGTSSFRLGLYDLTKRTLVGEIQSKDGISVIHQAWKAGNSESNGQPKDQLFRQKLFDQIQLLSGKLSVNLENITIVISGMASSSIGMEDIPYARLPFALDGSQAKTRHFPATKNFPHEIILISGVQSNKDVMRGEETQLIGLLSLLELKGIKPDEAILIFPGTHSKHIFIKNGSLIDFRSFMTGEIFNLIASYSILKDSVTINEENDFSDANLDAFKLGLKESGESGILNGLFTVRTNQLFKKLDKVQNAYYLSGLLIGTEINELVKIVDCPLFLCSGSNLYRFYKLAINELDLSGRSTIVSEDIVDRAAVAGQVIIQQNYLSNKTV